MSQSQDSKVEQRNFQIIQQSEIEQLSVAGVELSRVDGVLGELIFTGDGTVVLQYLAQAPVTELQVLFGKYLLSSLLLV
jgi:hypothetical protein